MPAKKKTLIDFTTVKWSQGSRVLTHRGYGVLKSVLNPEQEKWIRESLTVKPEAPPPYDAGLNAFTVYFESTER